MVKFNKFIDFLTSLAIVVMVIIVFVGLVSWSVGRVNATYQSYKINKVHEQLKSDQFSSFLKEYQIINENGFMVVKQSRKDNETQKILCTIEDLETYEFIQLDKNFKEYVCKNLFDSTDFIVINDLDNNLVIDDILIVTLNKNGEVMTYNHMDKSYKIKLNF